EDFGYRLAQLRQGFESRFGRPLTISGTDTADHVRLHGRGMAADIRTHGLGPQHLDWLRHQTQQLGLTCRDYSWLTRPLTTSTGVRLTGPHFHVHYGGAAQQPMDVFFDDDQWRRPVDEGQITIRAGPIKTPKSLEEQVADAQRSGQRIATGISAPDLLAQLQAGALSPQQLYVELQNRIAKNPPSLGGF